MNIENIFSPNKKCKHFNKINSGNLKVKQYQGKAQKIALLQCLCCGMIFSERRGTVYFGIKKPDYVFDHVIALLMTRISIKDIVRVTGVSEDTIGKWIKKAAIFLDPIWEKLLKNLQVTECQIDEMWTFVYMKRRRVKEKWLEGLDDKIGDQWIFIAFDAINKLVIHWKVGKRTLKIAKMFVKEVKSKISINPLYTTDELPAYEEAFLSNFCEESITAKTGKRGRPRKKPLKKVDPKLKLAQTHKQRENGKVINVTEQIIFGNEKKIRNMLKESPVSNCINTSFVERTNGTLRSKVSRAVRCCYSFSKKHEMHLAHLTIYFLYYNFR